WPWFLPQDGLRRDHLAGAVDAEADPAGAAAGYAQIPLVAAATALLEHVGQGREVTADGGLPLAEVHALLDAWQLDPGGQEPTTMWQVGEIAGPWNALLSGRSEERRVGKRSDHTKTQRSDNTGTAKDSG